MDKRKTNRREFLSLTGTTLAGLALVSGTLSLPEMMATPVAHAAKKMPVEQWLLSTGQGTLGPALSSQVLAQINNLLA